MERVTVGLVLQFSWYTPRTWRVCVCVPSFRNKIWPQKKSIIIRGEELMTVRYVRHSLFHKIFNESREKIKHNEIESFF
jgi:hypothetical protein